MSFKAGDFIKANPNVGYMDLYITEKSKIGYKWISLSDGLPGTDLGHCDIESNYELHPTLGIEQQDELKYSGNTFTSTAKAPNGPMLYLVEKTLCTTNAFTFEFILQNFTNITNKHWNTCAQHYKTHVLNAPSNTTTQVIASNQVTTVVNGVSTPDISKFKVGGKIRLLANIVGRNVIYSENDILEIFSVLNNEIVVAEDSSCYSINLNITHEGIDFELVSQLDQAVDTIQKEFGTCRHNFVEYTGLFEVFFHCSKCGIKKEESRA